MTADAITRATTGRTLHHALAAAPARHRAMGLDRLVAWTLCIGLAVCPLLDWLGDLFVGPEFKFISRGARACLLGIFIAYFLRTGLNFAARGFRMGFALGILAGTLFLYTLAGQEVWDGLYQYSRILFWIFGTVVAFRLYRKGAITLDMLATTARWVIAIAVVFTLIDSRRPEFEKQYNASAYLLLFTIPILLLRQKKPLFDAVMLALAVLGIVITVKRGAILALLVSTTAYLAVALYVSRRARQAMRLVVLAFVFTLAVAATMAWKWEAIERRTTAEQLFDPEKGGAGRLGIYRRLYTGWVQGSTADFFLGYGNRSHVFSARRRGTTALDAHSDIFAYLYDYGLVGIGLLLVFNVYFLRLLFTMVIARHPLAPHVAMAYIIYFMSGAYSRALRIPDMLHIGIVIAAASAAYAASVEQRRAPRLRLLRGGAPIGLSAATPAVRRQARPAG